MEEEVEDGLGKLVGGGRDIAGNSQLIPSIV